LLWQGAVLAAGFFSGALLARSLGPAARGDYQVVVLIYTMAAPFLGLGLGSGLSSGDRPCWPPPRRLAALLAVTAAVGSAAVLLAGLSAGPTTVLCALLWAPLLSPLTEAHLLRANRPALVQRLRVVDVASTSVLVTVLYGLGMLTPTGAALALLLPTAVLRAAVAVWALRRAHPGRRTTEALGRLVAHTARRFWPWDAVVAATAGIDMIVAALALERAELGIYAVAGAVGRLALAPFSAVAPHVLAAGAQGVPWSRVRLRWLGLPVVLVGVLLVALAASPIPLVELVYGRDYARAGVIAAVLVAAFAVQGVTSARESYVLGCRGRSVSPVPRLAAAGVMAAATLLIATAGPVDAVRLAVLTLLYSVVAGAATAVRCRAGRPS
jgi:O-antigen/teichoic acid export membrane protein